MIINNQDLVALNTFGLSAVARRYCFVHSMAQLEELELLQAPDLVLGSGSNILLLDQVPGLTLHMGIQGIEVMNERAVETVVAAGMISGPEVIVKVGAGVNWQQFVLYSLEKGWNGLENLALIPGTVGAAPVQNIGAYGVEIAERIHAVHVYEYGVGLKILQAGDCDFAYRNSRFKREPGRFLIVAVEFRLGGNYQPAISYGAILEKLAQLSVAAVTNFATLKSQIKSPQLEELPPSPKLIARAVMEIRANKLPFFSALGNCGSFFKNPVLPKQQVDNMLAQTPEMPSYPTADPGLVKVPAGWLIDQAGWKGKRIGAVGCYEKQALVIVNHGGATGRDVLAFSEKIQADVLEKFGVRLEREVQVVGVINT